MTLTEAFSMFYRSYLLNEDVAVKTRKNYTIALIGRSGLVHSVGDIPISTLGIDHIVQWKLDMRSEAMKPSSINKQLSCIRQFLRWLNENEQPTISPTKIPFEKAEARKPKTILTLDEVRSLINHAKNIRDKAIIALLFGTGCRSAEVLGIDRDQWEAATLVDPTDGVWEITILGKGQKYRPVWFFQEVKDYVDDYLSSRADRFKPLFISQQNRRIHHATVANMLHELTRRAGLDKRVTQHIFRHTYATEMGASGMPMPILAFNLGHKDATITQRLYTHINARHSRNSYAPHAKKLLTK